MDIAGYKIFGVPNYLTLSIVTIIAIAIFLNRIKYLYCILRLGQKDNRFKEVKQRIIIFFKTILLQKCALKSVLPSVVITSQEMQSIFGEAISL